MTEFLPGSPFSPLGPSGPVAPGGHLHLRLLPFLLRVFFCLALNTNRKLLIVTLLAFLLNKLHLVFYIDFSAFDVSLKSYSVLYKSSKQESNLLSFLLCISDRNTYIFLPSFSVETLLSPRKVWEINRCLKKPRKYVQESTKMIKGECSNILNFPLMYMYINGKLRILDRMHKWSTKTDSQT